MFISQQVYNKYRYSFSSISNRTEFSKKERKKERKEECDASRSTLWIASSQGSPLTYIASILKVFTFLSLLRRVILHTEAKLIESCHADRACTTMTRTAGYARWKKRFAQGKPIADNLFPLRLGFQSSKTAFLPKRSRTSVSRSVSTATF